MSRVQLALNVNDIDEAVSFYAKLFGTGPAKRRPGYANFAITAAAAQARPAGEPRPGRHPEPPRRGVDTTAAVEASRPGSPKRAWPRSRSGTHLLLRPAGQVWVTGAPGSERWEMYTVLQDSPTFWGQDGGQRRDAVQAELDAEPPGQATQCCGGP